MSDVINEHYAVLAFGVVLPTSCSTAQHILNAWLIGRAKGVQALEGSFSAVIINRATGAVVWMGDIMGRRRLRYHYARTRGTLLISPHDVSLVATGKVPVEFDDISAASIAVVKWSLGGKSLLSSVQSCHPSEYIHYSEGHISSHSLPLINPDERISSRDIKGIKRHRDQLIETARSHLKPLVSEPEIKASLTAGLDSRAMLSLLISVVDPKKITTFTSGQPNCLDVQIAQKLAHIAGVKHNVMSPEKHNENLINYADLLAFYFNGDATSKVGLISPLPNFQPNNQPHLGGLAAEIFRGFSYRKCLFPNLRPLALHSVVGMLAGERVSSHHLPWDSSELENAVHRRLEGLIRHYSTVTTDGYDILDLFNIYEVSGVWGARQQNPWNPSPKWSPFSSRQLLKLALRLPAPMGYHARIHQEAIRRYLPEAYWMAVNGQTLPALRSSELIASYRKKYQRGLRRLGLWRESVAANAYTPRDLQASALAGPVRQTVCDLLLDRDSFSRKIFSQAHLEALLMQEQFPTRIVDTIGSMVTMERWHRLMQGVRQEAQGLHVTLR
ncbi:hypothetical protein [Acaryochloris thomasi]|nr:hypothetical protein [Acaryochloris thomasi]